MYVGCLVESIVDVLFDDAGFTHRLPAQEDDLYLGLASHRADRVVHRNSNILDYYHHRESEVLL